MSVIKRMILSNFIVLMSICVISQENVSISDIIHTPHTSSVLDVYSTSKGMLIPRMTSLERIAIVNPADGLLVFDTDSSCVIFYRASMSQWYSFCNMME